MSTPRPFLGKGPHPAVKGKSRAQLAGAAPTPAKGHQPTLCRAAPLRSKLRVVQSTVIIIKPLKTLEKNLKQVLSHAQLLLGEAFIEGRC